MKRLFLLIFFFSASLQALPVLTKEALTGKWLIVQVGDIQTKEEELGEDYWIFENEKLTVESSGISMRPDPYKIENSQIIFGVEPYTVPIKVISISDKEMKVETRGFIQVLKKVK